MSKDLSRRAGCDAEPTGKLLRVRVGVSNRVFDTDFWSGNQDVSGAAVARWHHSGMIKRGRGQRGRSAYIRISRERAGISVTICTKGDSSRRRVVLCFASRPFSQLFDIFFSRIFLMSADVDMARVRREEDLSERNDDY